MLNILIPMGGATDFDRAEYSYPKPLIEINGKPLIELVVEGLDKIKMDKRFIFIVNAADCQKHHLDSVLRLITKDRGIVIQLEKETKGAACSALMAIDYIYNNDALMISNGDHIFDCDLNSALSKFDSRGVVAGTVCFDSVHPKWSFVRLDENKKIIETAEKRPLSRNAIAGLYYFQHGSDFVRAAMKTIEKEASVDGQFYVAPSLNELVLEGKNMEIYTIPSASYHNFYSPHKLKEYEDSLNARFRNHDVLAG
jgi:dTDP-glucose pyrophosphorylase